MMRKFLSNPSRNKKGKFNGKAKTVSGHSRRAILDWRTGIGREPGAKISDAELRGYLDWLDDRYNRTKNKLRDDGQIKVVSGYGGPIILPQPVHTPKKIFISYSQVDQEIQKQMVSHLQPLVRTGKITIWHDQMIKAGDSWEKKIWKKFDESDIVIMLISDAFISSEFCYEKEMEHALTAHEQGNVSIVPVVARDCFWKELPIAKIQALPPKGKAIMSHGNIDSALLEVVAGINAMLTVEKEA